MPAIASGDKSFSPNKGLAVVVGLPQASNEGDKSLVFCIEALGNESVIGPPFSLRNDKGCYIWTNVQIRNEGIEHGSVIEFERKEVLGSPKMYYLNKTKRKWDIDSVIPQLQFGGSPYTGKAHRGIRDGFPTVKISEKACLYQDAKEGPSPGCALVSVRYAVLVDGRINFITRLGEKCNLRNNCQRIRSSGINKVPLQVQDPSSEQDVGNCLLLVSFGEKPTPGISSQYRGKCEAILLKNGSSLKSYEMNRNPRGKCVILNNLHFQDETFNRRGAELDEQALDFLFRNLLFDVEIHRNLTSRGMRDLTEMIATGDHSTSDALFFIGMSHGGDCDTILGIDGRNVPIEDIMSEFKADRCKTLEGKPKVFLFQTCRCSSSEILVQRNCPVDSTMGSYCGDSTLRRGTSPQETDFLLAFSTAPGYYSYRDEVLGSPFIQTLVDVIKEYHQDSHLTEILHEVTRLVADKVFIQVPSNSNTLRAKLYFKVNNFINCKAEN